MTLYEQYLAARARAEDNARMDDLWRLGGFVLNVRSAVARAGLVTGRLAVTSLPGREPAPPIEVGSHSRIHYLPEIDPVTMTATGRPRIYREIA